MIELCQSFHDGSDALATAVVSRIYVTPTGARELHRLLGQSLDQQSRLHAQSARGRAR